MANDSYRINLDEIKCQNRDKDGMLCDDCLAEAILKMMVAGVIQERRSDLVRNVRLNVIKEVCKGLCHDCEAGIAVNMPFGTRMWIHISVGRWCLASNARNRFMMVFEPNAWTINEAAMKRRDG